MSAGFAPVTAATTCPAANQLKIAYTNATDRDEDQQRRIEDEVDDAADEPDERGEEDEQPERPPAVRADLLLEGHAGAKLTFTGSRSSVSKNSRSSNPSGRAMSTAGKLCLTVW